MVLVKPYIPYKKMPFNQTYFITIVVILTMLQGDAKFTFFVIFYHNFRDQIWYFWIFQEREYIDWCLHVAPSKVFLATLKRRNFFVPHRIFSAIHRFFCPFDTKNENAANALLIVFEILTLPSFQVGYDNANNN